MLLGACSHVTCCCCLLRRCGNVAAILELDDSLSRRFQVFEAAPQDVRGVPAKKAAPDYFL